MRHSVNHDDPAGSAIIFVHGLRGFVSCRLLGREIKYFRGLADALKDFGIPLYFPPLPPCGTITERAASLATYIAKISQRRLLLVGHSMGGLDCRRFIHSLDDKHLVRALVTLGTPHLGTPLADWLVKGSDLESKLARRWMMPGMGELTSMALGHFNRETPDRSDVRYFSYAGCRPVVEMPLLFRRWARRLEEAAGDNDGQVPVTSAAWGEGCDLIRADHWEMIGWSFGMPVAKQQRPFHHVALFRTILTKLVNELG